MSVEYRVDLHTAAGAKVAEIADYQALAYSRKVGEPGLLSFELHGDHPAVSQVERNGEAIVYRRNRALGLPWTADFWGLVRGLTRRYSDHETVEVRAPGLLTLLSWRQVLWYAGTVGRSKFDGVPAETVFKTLVDYNAGPNATVANGRVRAGTIPGLSVEADSGRGTQLTFETSWGNLLEALQRQRPNCGGEYDVVRTGAASWQFRWFQGQRGVDRTATTLFALDRGNMREPEYDTDWTAEKTVVIVGGQGDKSARQVVVRTGPDYAAGSNDVEMFVDARNNTTAAALQSEGDQAAKDNRLQPTLKFKVIQTPGCAYGVHYGFGDLVRASYAGVTKTMRVLGVSANVTETGEEQIDLDLEAV